MKKLIQACACLALAITASYFIWEKTNAAILQPAPTKTVAVITPVKKPVMATAVIIPAKKPILAKMLAPAAAAQYTLETPE